MKMLVHVTRHNIATNRKNKNSEKPVFTVKSYKENQRGNEVNLSVNGEPIGKFVYRPDKPHKCGAVAWFEFNSDSITASIS